MKTLITLLLMMPILMGFIPGETYIIDMKAHIKELNKADTEESISNVIEKLNIIKQSEPDEWLPSYYMAFAYLKLADLRPGDEEFESLLDEATTHVSNALDQFPTEPELMAMLANIYITKTKGKDQDEFDSYFQVANNLLESAGNFDPENPRVIFLTGKVLFERNSKSGDSAGESCRYFKLAADNFETYRQVSEIHPTWGLDESSRFAARCEEQSNQGKEEERK